MQSQKRQQSLHSQNQLPFSFFFFNCIYQVLYTQFAVLNIPKWNVNNEDKKNNLLYKSCNYKICTNRISILCISWFFFLKKKILSVHGARGDHRLIKLGMR